MDSGKNVRWNHFVARLSQLESNYDQLTKEPWRRSNQNDISPNIIQTDDNRFWATLEFHANRLANTLVRNNDETARNVAK